MPQLEVRSYTDGRYQSVGAPGERQRGIYARWVRQLETRTFPPARQIPDSQRAIETDRYDVNFALLAGNAADEAIVPV